MTGLNVTSGGAGFGRRIRATALAGAMGMLIWGLASCSATPKGESEGQGDQAGAAEKAGAKESAPKTAARRPNILFIFTDDHASHAIGAYGSKINQTPNLDRLAGEGMLFRNCFVTNSICAPSRAVILTGRHSHLNGVIDNRVAFDGSQRTFPKLLRKAGYQTAMIGKWHLKSDPTGFDYWEVLPGQGHYYNPDFRTAEGKVRYTGYVTDIITDRALEWLRNGRDANKPFMLMYQHKAPHRSWLPGPKHLTMYDGVDIPEPATLFDDYSGRCDAARMQEMTIAKHMSMGHDLKVGPKPPDSKSEQRLWAGTVGRLNEAQRKAWDAAYGPKNEALRKAKLTGKDLVRWKYQRYVKDYLRCIASVDDNIGRVLAYLDETGLADNTVVIYSSDQGFYLGDHGWFDKRWMYEESLRMPLIVRWPGVVRAGSEDTHMVQNLDFARTFLAMAGVAAPKDMQGRSLVGLLKGERPSDWRKSMYYHYWEFPGAHSVQRHYGVRTERHKLIHYYEIDQWELFDLKSDPQELRSLYDDPAQAGTIKTLKAELKRLQTECGDTTPQASAAEIGQRRIRRMAQSVKLRQVLAMADQEAEAPANLDPSAKPLTAGAWIQPQAEDGVIVAHGGESLGYSLYLKGGIPRFAVRDGGRLLEVAGTQSLPTGGRTHVAGVLSGDGALLLYVNGKRVAEADGHFISKKPADGLSIGADGGSRVGTYDGPPAFKGKLTDIRVYWGRLGEDAIRQWASGNN